LAGGLAGQGVPPAAAVTSEEDESVRIFLKDFLIAAAGLSLGAFMAADAVAKESVEGSRLAEVRLLPAEDSKPISPVSSADGNLVFVADILHSAGQPDPGADDLAYSRRTESCSFVRLLENLEAERGCGTEAATCLCDDMGITIGGGGCIGCYR
jgi:hypothetical protein